MSQASVEKWIAQRLVQVPMPEKFSLRHANAETGESDLVGRIIATDGDPVELGRAVARQLYDLAKDHSGAWPGRAQLYKVAALVKGKSEGTFCFRTRTEGRASDMALAQGSEPPTPGGIAAQHMRFTEAAIRIALEANAETIDALRAENRELRAERERDQDRRQKFIATFEEMMDRRAERDITIRRFEDQSGRRNLMLTKVAENVLPAVAGKLPGLLDALLGNGPSAKDILGKLFNVLSALPAEQRNVMLRDLPDEARADLESLLDAMGAAAPH